MEFVNEMFGTNFRLMKKGQTIDLVLFSLVWFSLVSKFDSISTFVDYLMAKPSL